MHPELMMFVGGIAATAAGCMLPARWLPRLPNDKLLHAGAFALLTLLASRLASDHTELLYLLLLLLIAGIVIEILQHWVPGRRCCWRDVIANAVGIGSAACFLMFDWHA